jgi:ketosteroid isomerase-like protein
MAAADVLDQVIEQYHQALGEFMKGDPEPVCKLHSHREDVTLANPRGGIAHGWGQVAQRMKDVASGRQEGKISFEIVEKYVTPELACVVEMERAQAKFGGMEETTPYALRVTILFRREEGTWKVAHRHADPISNVQPTAFYEVD